LKYLTFVLLLSFLLISCEKEDSGIVDPILTFPSITNAFLYPSIFDTSAVNSVAVALVTSEESIQRVTAKVTNPDNNDIGTFELRDNGVLPADTTAGDGRYSGIINFSMNCRIVGSYRVEFLAQNVSGLFSNNFISNFQVVNSQNSPPVISNLIIIPDSSRIGVNAFFIFQVTASDPDGNCDIKVYYDGKRPDGSDLTRTFLFDDGSCCLLPPFNTVSGDTTANDGKYTRRTLGAPNQLGYYKYYLIAVDRTGDSSSVLSDSIYVYP
ncbi:MAG: hypothetical protein ACRDFC_03385, partial [Ignavibacteria bacterium]